MNTEELIHLGKQTYGRDENGYGWQTRMAKDLGIASSTVSSWTKNLKPIYRIAEIAIRARHKTKMDEELQAMHGTDGEVWTINIDESNEVGEEVILFSSKGQTLTLTMTQALHLQGELNTQLSSYLIKIHSESWLKSYANLD